MNNKIAFDVLDSVHTIIAGVTGSGKSVLLNNIIYTIITHYDCKGCRLILCDPKRIEFAKYKNLPHVLHYGNDTRSILRALHKAHDLMDKRYQMAEDDPWSEPDFTPVYIIIDELADLFLNGGKELKTVMQSLAQKGRAANIHMIVATQHPSRQQFPSFIQDNFNTKIALHCDTTTQSRQILGTTGAETLTVGNAIVKMTGKPSYRIHIPMIEKDELRRTVETIVNECTPKFDGSEASHSPTETVSQTSRSNDTPLKETALHGIFDGFAYTVKVLVMIPVCIVGMLLGKC